MLLAAFVIAGVIHYTTNEGGDLGPSYIACRLIAQGQASHIYAYDPQDFTSIAGDEAWKAIAAEGVRGTLHPYVQTPLWASMLRPLCTRTSFLSFYRVFAVLTMSSFAAIVWIVGRRWTPELLNPYAVSLILILLYLSTPFRFAMLLMQTHVLFFLMIIGSLLLAERGHPVTAGVLLACAAAVKITPGFLVVYWILGRRWKAAGSMVGSSIVLWGLTLAVCGQTLWHAYLADLNRISQSLLVSGLNQSFAAWLMGRSYSWEELEQMHVFLLPPLVKFGSTLLMLACLLIGSLVDRQKSGDRSHRLPLGAMIALVSAMIFSPIAWVHYFIILMVPLMFLVHENRKLNSTRVRIAIGVVILLNLHIPPSLDRLLAKRLFVHDSFFSGVLCLLLLMYAAWKRSENEASKLLST